MTSVFNEYRFYFILVMDVRFHCHVKIYALEYAAHLIDHVRIGVSI